MLTGLSRRLGQLVSRDSGIQRLFVFFLEKSAWRTVDAWQNKDFVGQNIV